MLYQFSENIEGVEETFKSLQKENGVIVFGTGNCGALVIAALKKAHIKIIALADNNDARWGENYYGFEVLPPSNWQTFDKSIPVIVASDLNFPYIKRQLKSLGFSKILDCDFIFAKLDLELSECDVNWSKEKIKQKIDTYMFSVLAQKQKDKYLKVNGIDLVLTEKCSLKCKDCSNLMQLYAKPIDEDFEELIASIDTFLTTVDYVHEIRLIGGEPLMYKKIDLVIEHLLTYNNYDRINVYTNGTIVPNEHKMDIFKNANVFFDISDYGKHSRNLQRLIDELEKRNIRYDSKFVTSWQDCGRIVKTNRTNEENKAIFGNCCENQGLTILHGKLYLCPFSAHATNLKAIPLSPTDIVDLEAQDELQLKDQIKRLYFNTKFLEACRACNGRHPNVSQVEAAVQVKKPLEYERVTETNNVYF